MKTILRKIAVYIVMALCMLPQLKAQAVSEQTDPELYQIMLRAYQKDVLQAHSQLHSHFLGCLKAGNSPETVVAAVINCMPHIGFPATINTLRIIIEVLEKQNL